MQGEVCSADYAGWSVQHSAATCDNASLLPHKASSLPLTTVTITSSLTVTITSSLTVAAVFKTLPSLTVAAVSYML